MQYCRGNDSFGGLGGKLKVAKEFRERGVSADHYHADIDVNACESFAEFGGAVPYRPAEDLAYSVAKFIQSRGSFINYYMYHGGANFGWTAGGPFIARSYDYHAPLDKFGLKREAKWGHLKDLHKAIKLYEPALINGDPSIVTLGNYQKAYVYNYKTGGCAAFHANNKQAAYAHAYAHAAFHAMSAPH